jgi:protein kinase A
MTQQQPSEHFVNNEQHLLHHHSTTPQAHVNAMHKSSVTASSTPSTGLYSFIILTYKCFVVSIKSIIPTYWYNIFHTYSQYDSVLVNKATDNNNSNVDNDDDDDELSHSSQKSISIEKHNDDNCFNHSTEITTTECDDSMTYYDDDDDDDEHEHDVVNRNVIEEAHSYTFDDFDRHRILGTGQFGQVWLVSKENKKNSTTSTTSHSNNKDNHRNTSKTTTYALKVLSKYDLITLDEVDTIIRERDIMQQLRHHPFIVQFHASFQNDYFVFILQEFCQGGELFTLLHRNNHNRNDNNLSLHKQLLPEQDVVFYTLCIADALEYMHIKHSIVYRDLKPENVMIDQYGYPKLIDMGYAKRLQLQDDNYKTYTFCGTPNYVAPEMIQSSSDGCSFHVDHWAFGVLLYEMLSGRHPFNTNNIEMDTIDLYDCICNDEYTEIPTDIGISDDGINLISQLLQKDPTQRLGRSIIGGKSICHHPFYHSMNIYDLRTKQIMAPWIPDIQNELDTKSFDDDDTHDEVVEDRLRIQQYPKLTKREAALFDRF